MCCWKQLVRHITCVVSRTIGITAHQIRVAQKTLFYCFLNKLVRNASSYITRNQKSKDKFTTQKFFLIVCRFNN